MLKLTVKEEELMRFFWERGALFIKEILVCYDEPRPHFNTLSTIARGLEEKGFLAHKVYGNTHQYYALIGEEQYCERTLRSVVGKYFHNSYLHAVSSLVRSEKISIEELKTLIREVETKNSK
ncbi:MAG: BlaI/MecI/CopY family transcriptional regulator [Tannerella sp.]|jgi:predicted transcriptional regulator|nr:BlaI/MecI/CopY family transcriptional regulator [Tannerella sp.]